MNEPDIMPGALKPEEPVAIRSYPHCEPGVLASSILYIHLPSHFARETLFYAPHIGKFFCNKNYSIQRNNYEHYLCLLVESGTLSVSANGKKYAVKPQNILLLNCKEPHACRATGELSFRYFLFDGFSSPELYNRLASLHGNVVKNYNRPVIEDAFNAMLSLACDGYRNEPEISARIHLILCELLSPELLFKNRRSQAIARSISFMENNFFQDISPKEIADSVCYSECYFSHLFKKQTGISLHRYLQNLRIDFARLLLSATAMPVELVAEKCCFSSVQNFIREFNKKIGCTPRGYRRKTAADKFTKINRRNTRKTRGAL